MLESTFQFTQSNLQDYLTCPQRFALRYLRRINWPAIEVAPVHEAERRMQLGSHFHRLIHQYLLGVPEALLTESAAQIAILAETPELDQMWQHFLHSHPTVLDHPQAQAYPEITLSTTLNGYRLTAKYDLLLFLPGTSSSDPTQIHIFDWKTAFRRPPSQRLQQQAQSRVYPLVLVQAGKHLDEHRPLSPDQVTMTYWFANFPQEPETIVYNQAHFKQDQTDLQALVLEIAAATDFPLTTDKKACRFCVYRSYCDRGQVAGLIDEATLDDTFEMDELTLDWEQITEIAY